MYLGQADGVQGLVILCMGLLAMAQYFGQRHQKEIERLQDYVRKELDPTKTLSNKPQQQEFAKESDAILSKLETNPALGFVNVLYGHFVVYIGLYLLLWLWPNCIYATAIIAFLYAALLVSALVLIERVHQTRKDCTAFEARVGVLRTLFKILNLGKPKSRSRKVN